MRFAIWRLLLRPIAAGSIQFSRDLNFAGGLRPARDHKGQPATDSKIWVPNFQAGTAWFRNGNANISGIIETRPMANAFALIFLGCQVKAKSQANKANAAVRHTLSASAKGNGFTSPYIPICALGAESFFLYSLTLGWR
jgi:hypothetical protein